MGVTVGELVRMPHLGLDLHSGGAGLAREVTWTHTSDLPEPWRWLGRGELLMANGMSLPPGPQEQVDWVEHLDAVGASGLALGRDMYCPPLTPELVAASDRVRLPVLWIRYPLPFVAVARAVAEATLLEQSHRLLRTTRIYDTLRRVRPTAGPDSAVAAALSHELGAVVHVCDRASGRAYHPGGPAPSASVSDAVVAAQAGRAGLVVGGRSVLLPDGDEVLVVEVPTHDDAVLAVVRPRGAHLDGILLQHAATVAALELGQTRLALEHSARAGAELVTRLVEGRVEARSARRQLMAEGLDPAHTVVAALRHPEATRLHDLHVRLWREGVAHVAALRSGVLLVLAHDTPRATQVLVDAVSAEASGGGSGHVGLGGALVGAGRVADASREATWSLGVAAQTGRVLHRFGDATTAAVGLSVEQEQSLVDQVLGPVLRHDAEHHSELVLTLETFLDERRSWQATAAVLHVHRQTVLYRIKQVEQLTGRALADTGDLARLWLALQARRRLAGLGASE